MSEGEHLIPASLIISLSSSNVAGSNECQSPVFFGHESTASGVEVSSIFSLILSILLVK